MKKNAEAMIRIRSRTLPNEITETTNSTQFVVFSFEVVALKLYPTSYNLHLRDPPYKNAMLNLSR